MRKHERLSPLNTDEYDAKAIVTSRLTLRIPANSAQKPFDWRRVRR